MENMSAWKIIKIGFLLGIGFIIPSFLMNAALLGLSLGAVATGFEELENEYFYEDPADAEEDFLYPGLEDYTDSIELGTYSSNMLGNQLLIQGTVTNKGNVEINSVEVEAELYNDAGEFVYECSEYIHRKLSPSQVENYQIKCGCSKNGLPEFSTLKLRIVKASSY